MPFQSKKERLHLAEADHDMLQRVSHARTEEYRRVERIRMLLHYVDGLSVPKIAEMLGATVPKGKPLCR